MENPVKSPKGASRMLPPLVKKAPLNICRMSTILKTVNNSLLHVA